MQNELKWPPAPKPAAPAEPVAFDRAAVRAEIKAVDEAFNRRRPLLEDKARQARHFHGQMVANEAAARADRDKIEGVLLAAHAAAAAARNRLVAKLLANKPAALIEAEKVLAAHRHELLNGGVPVGRPDEFARIGRRAVACAEAALALDALAADGLDGEELDRAIVGVFAQVDAAEADTTGFDVQQREPAPVVEAAWYRLTEKAKDIDGQKEYTPALLKRRLLIQAAMHEIGTIRWWDDGDETKAAVQEIMDRARA